MISWVHSVVGRQRPQPSPSLEFRAIAIAEGLSALGDQVSRVAISLLVFSRTNSAALTALTYAMTFLPDLFAGYLLSWTADRYPRRTVMITCALLQAGVVTVMILVIDTLAVVAICVAAVAALSNPYRAALNATVQELGSSHQARSRFFGRQDIIREMGQLLGLAGAGALVGWLGVRGALALDAATFVCVAVLVSRLRGGPRPVSPENAPDPSALPLTRRGRKALACLQIMAGFSVLSYGLIVPVAAEIGAPQWSIGWLLAAEGLGLLVSMELFRGKGSEWKVSWLGPMFVACPLLLALFGLQPHAILAAVILAASGAANASLYLAKSLYLDLFPPEFAGRASGIIRANLRTCQGVSLLVGGMLAQWWGSPTLAIAVLCGVSALGSSIAWRVMHRARLTPPEARAASTPGPAPAQDSAPLSFVVQSARTVPQRNTGPAPVPNEP